MAGYDWTVKAGADFGDVFRALKGLSTAGQQAGKDLGKELDAGLKTVPATAKKAADAVAATGTAASKAGRDYQVAANGLKFYIDAQGRARDEAGKFLSATQKAAAGVEDVGKKAKVAIPGVEGLLSSLAGFISAGAAVAFVVNEVRKFDAASAAVRTLGVDAEALSASLKQVSDETGGAASQVELLKAAYDVASSGFSSAADATAILEAATFGARGGFSDLNTVADATTSVLNAYGLSAENATRIVDGFITTQNDGKIVVGQYAKEIGNVAAIASAAGVSIEELNAAIATATAKGVPVAQTFTGLRQAISSILKPTSEASTLASELGLQFNAQALQAKGLGQFLAEVNEKTKGSVALNTVLFSSVEAVAAVQPLLNDSLEAYNRSLDNQRNSSGAARKAYAEIATSIDEATARITGSLSNLAVEAQGVVSPALLGGLNTLAGLLEVTSKNFGTIIAVGAGIAGVVAVLNAGAIAARAWATAQAAVATATAILTALTGGAGLARVAGALAAGAVVAAALKVSIDSISDAAGGAADQTKLLKDEIARTKKLIEDQKEYKLDTTAAEEKLTALEKKLAIINAQTAKEDQRGNLAKEIKDVEGAIKKLEDGAGFFGEKADAGVIAQLQALNEYKRVLDAIRTGPAANFKEGLGGPIANVSDAIRKAAKDLFDLQGQLDQLNDKKAAIPITATTDRAEIDDEIVKVKQQFEKARLVLKADIDLERINAAIAGVRKALRDEPQNAGLKQQLSELLTLQAEAVVKRKEALELRKQDNEDGAKGNKIDEFAVEVARRRLALVDQVNQLRREGNLRELDDQIALQSKALEFGRIVDGLESSRSGILTARNDRLISFYQEQGGQELRIAELKRQNEQIEAVALERRFALLIKTQQVEAVLLDLQRQKAKLAQDLEVIAAREAVSRQQQAVAEAETSGDATRTATEREQLKLAQERLGVQLQASALLTKIQPIEALIAQASAEQARNGLLAQGARAGIEGNLRAIQDGLKGSALSVDQITAANLQQFFGRGADQAGNLSTQLGTAAQSAEQLYDQLRKTTGLDTIRAGRFTGGPVSPGSEYTVNEWGQESFLDRAGNLSLINRPAFAAWRPPSPGLVIPAGITADLKARGGLTPGGGTSMAQMAGAVGNLTRQVAELQTARLMGAGGDPTLAVAVRELRAEVRRLTDKDWHATVVAPSEPNGLAIARRYRRD